MIHETSFGCIEHHVEVSGREAFLLVVTVAPSAPSDPSSPSSLPPEPSCAHIKIHHHNQMEAMVERITLMNGAYISEAEY